MFSEYNFRNYNFRLLFYVLALNLVGVVVINSAVGGDRSYVNRQLIGLFGGLMLAIAISLMDYRKLMKCCGLVYIGCVGILLAVIVAGQLGGFGGGSRRWIDLPVIGRFQPSEFVKILFVFFVASSLKKSTEFKNVVVTTALAAAHVLILVLSTDLGAALIMFVVYLVMLYVATQQPLYAVAGVGAGSFAAVIGYKLFAHIKVRVAAWKDPFATYSDGGYQVAQSLFAIGTGSWFGMGLCQGSPDLIPVAETDFIFSAIAEELGVIFALCLILVCVSCYVMFLNIAMEIRNRFYKLIALGLGTCYIFQVFLTIGGVTKFIPSTGVTLPLVSYGGSSMLSTMIMFGIIQGLYIIREDEEEEIIEKKRERANRNEPRRTAKKKPTQSKPKQQRPSGTEPERPKQKRKKPAFEEVPKQRVR